MASKKPELPSILISKDLEAVIICALRYSMPRSTYMPFVVADFIASVWMHLSSHTKEVIHRDILEFYPETFADKVPWNRIIALKIDDKKD